MQYQSAVKKGALEGRRRDGALGATSLERVRHEQKVLAPAPGDSWRERLHGSYGPAKTDVVIACVHSTLLKVVETSGTGIEGRERDEEFSR